MEREEINLVKRMAAGDIGAGNKLFDLYDKKLDDYCTDLLGGYRWGAEFVSCDVWTEFEKKIKTMREHDYDLYEDVWSILSEIADKLCEYAGVVEEGDSY